MEPHLIKSIEEAAERNLPLMKKIRDTLYAHPETGGEEKESSALLAGILRSSGFQVTESYGGIPYAFRAVWPEEGPGEKAGGKKAAIFVEFDALPGIGHGCGHNLIAATSVGAAVSLKEALEAAGNAPGGRILVYGTPGEENICSKTTLAEMGLFDEADAGMMIHPFSSTYASGRTLALEPLTFDFFGRSSHAGTEPEKGINALDAAVSFYQMVREESGKYPDTNVHGIITEGGLRANIIPDHTRLVYMLRAWTDEMLARLHDMMVSCADRACAETGCTWSMFRHEPANHSMRTDAALSETLNRYLERFGENDICREDLRGTTDMADVSLRIPSVHPWVSLGCPGTALHTEAFARATVSEYSETYLLRCAKALACTAAEVLHS